MQYRPGRESDFAHLSTFVWQAIFPDFDLPELSDEQRAENDRTVAEAADQVLLALTDPRSEVISAWDEHRRALAGYIVVTRSGKNAARVDHLVVRRADRGKGVAEALFEAAVKRIGSERDILVALRPYNERARAFFSRLGFADTGEAAGDVFPAYPLWMREGAANAADVDDFPTEADEPYFEPVYETLPDYNLATEELSADPVFDPEQSYLDEAQLSELEAFIARAKARKQAAAGAEEEKKSPPPTSEAPPPPPNRHPEVEFEIDLGGEEEPEAGGGGLSFEFAFEDQSTEPAPRRPEPTERETGYDDPLELKDIPPDPSPAVTPGQLRGEFEDRLGERLAAYFGADALPDYLKAYAQADNFHRIRDVALQGLAAFLNGQADRRRANRRRRDVVADLIEYFVVETAEALHGAVIDQRVLRYQGVDWRRVDLFKMVMDYLGFGGGADGVYTDFVTMPPRILKNATAGYLQATRDERVLFICDQSLFGNGKVGYAMTDAAIYWKSVLQPASAATYTTLGKLERQGDHLLVDGQYLNAGEPFNLRLALLLDKLRRLELGD
ncbi:GNAT superfamily N-acetyltransferase [Lewinella marina]|uniref:N-acetyltransferase domain-containing protein n=1 Tax=Neolewinella marina TaxID=438751 RepID=A0A2G0CFE3_9BACT|nr:GNAT family N-acetyltransferase [Neolewinella marina]NJB85669.1 GNAT superfamily N-acetyltransferase [Neolewinella marina]PHK98650.1 hypothetical protein CGL56_09270 [Neolewinella marina]